MKTPQQNRDESLEILKFFLKKLEEAQQPLEIEAQAYALFKAAERTFESVRVLDKEGIHNETL